MPFSRCPACGTSYFLTEASQKCRTCGKELEKGARAEEREANSSPEYCCPLCGSKSLRKRGWHSLLDNKRKWRCLSCGSLLGTNRSRAVLLAHLVVCVIATVACWAIAVITVLSVTGALGNKAR